jgi:hypothetical protein
MLFKEIIDVYIENHKKLVNTKFTVTNYNYLFVCSLLYDALSVTKTMQSRMKGDKWIMNWKGFRRKRSWPNLKYYPEIRLERLEKPRKPSVYWLLKQVVHIDSLPLGFKGLMVLAYYNPSICQKQQQKELTGNTLQSSPVQNINLTNFMKQTS